MTRRAAINLGLLALAAVLALVAWLRPGLDTVGAVRSPLTSLDPASVETLILTPQGSDEVRLHRGADGRWRIEGPVDLAADEARVERILPLLAAPVTRAFPAEGARLSDYGLDDPRMEVIADDQVIRLGGSEPLRHRRYVLTGDRVALVDDGYLPWLQGEAADFVSRRLLPPGVRLASLELGDVRVWKAPDGRWAASPGVAEDGLQSLGRVWEMARAAAVEPIDAETRLEVGDPVLRLGFDGGGTIAYTVVAADDGSRLLVRPETAMGWRLEEAQARRLLLLEEG